MRETIDVANVLLENKAAEILVLQRSPRLRRAYLWGLPGGLLDPGETVEQAALRELEEEAGVAEALVAVRGTHRFLVETPEQDLRIHNVRAQLTVDTVSITLDPLEQIAYAWREREELYRSSRLIPGLPTMIAAILAPGRRIEDLTLSPGITVSPL